MKVIIVAGTPGAGKTAVLLHTLKVLADEKRNVSAVKVDCLYTEDHLRFQNIGIPTLMGLSRDMCPDHYTIYNLGEMIDFANRNQSETLVVETAGLCHRCAPYTENCLGVCVIDATTGPNTPLKVGPFLSTANVVVITKGDVISQAEREIFRERILEMNPNCRIIEANGLTGKGAMELASCFDEANSFAHEQEKLRHNAPFSICTLCVGEMRIHQQHHRGVLRHINGLQEYVGE
ncbi:GTP-binding protein [Mangrovibacterium marinum]|uniref:Ni2+-binding GTPase involved in maturation of urease and hydrogenase n=1 Tax=Mangrovibacterium marinum TaxID=1639118 RepID=A0A2T5C5G8_9BACT|nr:GTP-binding protein [Mangrovibacterium marinum]PTN10108.1 Ni2+-binding GTPase involved in maturation of urease and hydrogenase [Mangrovibacterium marinum]